MRRATFHQPGVLLSLSQPSPAPRHPISRRLEDIRKRAGIPSVKDFWKRLEEAGPEGESFVSYASARLYHYDRTPSIEYLLRVVRVFGASLWSLATGEDEQPPTGSASADPGGSTISFRATKASLALVETTMLAHQAAHRLDVPFGAREIVVNYAVQVFFWLRIGSNPDSPPISLSEVEEFLREGFAFPLELSGSGTGTYGEVMAAFSSTAATLYLRAWAGSEGPKASETDVFGFISGGEGEDG